MDGTLLYFLIGCIAWAALLHYVFIIRRAQDPGAGGISALVIITLLIIPLLGLVLWNQNQSFRHLERLGFIAFDGLDNSIGVATGSGPNPTWLYSLSVAESEVLDFYRQPANHPGWLLTSATDNALVFERGACRMRLQTGNGQAAFLLFSPAETKPNEIACAASAALRPKHHEQAVSLKGRVMVN